MSLTLGIILGILGTTIFVCLAGGIILLMYVITSQKYNRIIRINNWNAGRVFVENYKARVMKHKSLGDVYYIPALKKEDRQYVPYFGSQYEYSTNKTKKFFVPLTFLNGTYAPESYEIEKETDREVIVKKDKEYIRTTEKVKNFIVVPVKASIRQFNLEMDTQIKDEYELKPGWWSKYGHLVLGIGMLVTTMIVCIMMIVFAYQWGVDISQHQPEWMVSFMEKVASVQAPPT